MKKGNNESLNFSYEKNISFFDSFLHSFFSCFLSGRKGQNLWTERIPDNHAERHV
jgi:hypothetical protein